jgi:hypothetical protein
LQTCATSKLDVHNVSLFLLLLLPLLLLLLLLLLHILLLLLLLTIALSTCMATSTHYTDFELTWLVSLDVLRFGPTVSLGKTSCT